LLTGIYLEHLYFASAFGLLFRSSVGSAYAAVDSNLFGCGPWTDALWARKSPEIGAEPTGYVLGYTCAIEMKERT